MEHACDMCIFLLQWLIYKHGFKSIKWIPTSVKHVSRAVNISLRGGVGWPSHFHLCFEKSEKEGSDKERRKIVPEMGNTTSNSNWRLQWQNDGRARDDCRAHQSTVMSSLPWRILKAEVQAAWWYRTPALSPVMAQSWKTDDESGSSKSLKCV